MIRKFSYFLNLSIIAFSTLNVAQAGTIERAPLGEKIAPFVQTGKIVAFTFSDGQDGTNPAVKYELHAIESMLTNGAAKITFDIENGKPGTAGYFKAKYRVIYMTKPFTASAIVDTHPSPTPPMFGNPVSKVYVMGVLIDTNIAAPKLTPWLSLESVQLVFDKQP